MRPVSNYLSLVKFSHTVFALPFALLGFFTAVWYGKGVFSFGLLVKVLLCMVFARTAAMAFNRYLDRDIDKKNPRTLHREIPAGVITPAAALIFVFFNAIAFVFLTWHINRLVFFLSPVALLVILGYSYTKRFSFLCHFILGLGLSLAPIGAYLAVTGRFDLLPLLYSISVLLWVSGFDILYSLQDEEFDRKEKLYSIPVVAGRKKSLVISALLHILSTAVLAMAGYLYRQGWMYWMGLFLYAGVLYYQHRIVARDIATINRTFTLVNGIASILFSIFAIVDMVW